MLRSAFAALASLATLLLGFSAASAEEVKGTVKKTNVAGNTITLGIDGKDKVFSVSKDASFVTVSSDKGKKGKPMEKVTPIDGGLGGIKEGTSVTLLTDKVDNKDTVTSVKVGTGTDTPAKKKKKKAAAKTAFESTQLVSTSEELTAAPKAKKAPKAKGKKGKAKGKKSKKTSLTAKKAKKAPKAKGKKGKAKGKKGKKTSLTAAKKAKKGKKGKGKGKKKGKKA